MKRILLALLLLLLTAVSLPGQTIEFWQFATDPAIKPTINAMVAEFETANPGVEINVTDLTWSHGHEKIVLAFASGEAPDVVELGSDWIAQFAATGHLEDISGYLKEDSADLQGLSMAYWNEGLFAYPWYLGTRVMFYNNDLIEQAGYAKGFQPLTDSEFRKLTTKVRKLAPDIYGWGTNSPEKHRLYKKFLPFLWTSKAQILSDDGRYCVISSEYAVQSLKYYVFLCQITGYLDTQRGIDDAFLDGKIGAILSGDWLLKRIKTQNHQINFSTGLFPGTGFPGISFMGGEFLAVAKQSPEKELAMKFIKFICSPENQVRFCKANQTANPSSKIAQKDQFFQSDPNMKTFIQQIRMANHPPVHPRWVEIEAVIEEAVENALFKGYNAGRALHEAQKKIAIILAK